MAVDLGALKQLLVGERGVHDVTADHAGFHIQARTEKAAAALRSRFPRYRGMSVRVSVVPITFLGSPVVMFKRDTGEVHEAARGVLGVTVSRCVGSRMYTSVLLIHGKRPIAFKLPSRKTVWRAVRDAELQAQSLGRAVRASLRGVRDA